MGGAVRQAAKFSANQRQKTNRIRGLNPLKKKLNISAVNCQSKTVRAL